MNQTITLNGGGLSLGVVAAGALLAYSVWLGQRELGLRASRGILAATVLTTLVPLLMLLVPVRAGPGGSPLFLLSGVLSPCWASCRCTVAANWLGVIRRAANPAA